jgi:hypothetical protein
MGVGKGKLLLRSFLSPRKNKKTKKKKQPKQEKKDDKGK